MSKRSDRPSGVLPTDPFDQMLAGLIGLPNGGHTSPAVVQAIDFYGHSTAYMLQTVRAEDGGPTVFVTQVNSGGAVRYILPAAVLRVIDRQREAITAQIRRRHGRRLAESTPPPAGGFTPAARAKGLATRRAKAAARAARKAAKARR